MDESKYDKIERYLLEEMPSKEEHEFEKELNESEDLRDDTKFMAYVINSVQKAGLEEDNRRLTAMRASMVGDNKRYWMSTAAMIAVALFIGVYAANRYFMPHGKQGSEQSIEGNEYDPNQTAPEIKPNSPQDLHPADSCKKTNDSIIDNKKAVTPTGGNEPVSKQTSQGGTSSERTEQPDTQNVVSKKVYSGPDEGVIEGHEFVNLGLSVRWATMNVGATKIAKYGDYFAWGDTYSKSEYKENNCFMHGREASDLTVDRKHDAAHVNWGGSWRMPTRNEWIELMENCKWEFISKAGVYGYEVTSNINKKSIFLPAAGIFGRGGLEGIDSRKSFSYWTSTPNTDKHNAQAWVFAATTCKTMARYIGCVIRPVTE